MKPARVPGLPGEIPAKKTSNVSVPTDVYLDAKMLGVNMSEICEQRLREEIQRRKGQQWNEQHASFLAAYNSLIEENGMALQEWRSF